MLPFTSRAPQGSLGPLGCEQFERKGVAVAVVGIQWISIVMQVRDRLRADIAHGRLVTDHI